MARKVSKETTVAIVVIVAVIVVMAAFVVVVRPFSNTSYVTAQADRSSYTIGEDITFKLVAQNSFMGHFRSTGYTYDTGVYINKVPEGVALDDFVANSTSYSVRAVWPMLSPQVTFSQFNSDSAPLELKWNGMYQERNETTGDTEYDLATSGYYFILPKLFVTEGDYVVSKIDRSSIFYLDSVNVSMGFSYQSGSGELKLDLKITDPTQTLTNSTLVSKLDYYDLLEEQPYPNQTLVGWVAKYLNASVDLTDGGPWSGSLTATSPYLADSLFQYVGVLSTDQGRYTFGVIGSIKNGELSVSNFH
jgi:hypothetical protein